MNYDILDLRGLTIRAFYSSGGKKAEEGFANFMERFLDPLLSKGAQPINIILVGEGGNQRRRDIYEKYKFKPEQDAEDEAVTEQKRLAHKMIYKFMLGLGCPAVSTKFCEADDTIGLLCQKLEGTKTVWTVDKDLTAICNSDLSPDDETTVMLSDGLAEEVEGIPFYQVGGRMVTLYKSIVGDASDQYKGVPGMGPAAFSKLVQEYGWDGCDQLIEAVDSGDFRELEEYRGEKPIAKLLDNKDSWRTSWLLAKLHPEWCYQTYQRKAVRPEWEKRLPEMWRLEKVMTKLGLPLELLDKYRKYTVNATLIECGDTILDAALAELKMTPVLAFDYESYDPIMHEPYRVAKKGRGFVDVLSQEQVGMSFVTGANLQNAYYLPVKHRDTNNHAPAVIEGTLVAMSEAEEETGAPITAHNASFERAVSLTNLEIEFDTMHDTTIMSSYVDENSRASLKYLSKALLNYDQATYADTVGDGDMTDISGEEVLQYGCDDSIVCGHLHVLFKLIMQCEDTWNFYCKNEPYFETLTTPQFVSGIPIDFEKMEGLDKADTEVLKSSLSELQDTLKEHCSKLDENAFHTLWAEVLQYETAKLEEAADKKADKKEEAGEFDDEIYPKSDFLSEERDKFPDILDKKEEEFRGKCIYKTFAPKEPEFTRQWVSDVAKSLGLPGVRSIRREKLADYADGIRLQTGEDLELTREQTQFVQIVDLLSEDNAQEDFLEFAADVAGEVEDGRPKYPDLWEGTELNVNSPPQMAQLFYGMMGLPILIRNEAKEGSKRDQFSLEGAPSTGSIAMETWKAELEDDDWRKAAIENVLSIRAVNTKRGLYYRPYPLWAAPQDGRIHPQIKNCGTITRRPSGTSPNILQVSKKDPQIRQTFLPQSRGEVVVSIDFSQQELAILAAMSQDENLLSCYTGPLDKRRDVHSMTGMAVLEAHAHRRTSYAEFVSLLREGDPEVILARKQAKMVNFLIVYGGSAAGLSRKLVVPKSMAKKFYDGFHKTYPSVADYQNRMVTSARKQGFVLTPFGNRKHCYPMFSASEYARSSWERQSINFPIQGGAADVLKMLLAAVVQDGVFERTKALMYAPVYDEVVSSVPVKGVAEYVQTMQKLMSIEIPGTTPVVLTTDVSIGKTWGRQLEISSPHATEEEITGTLKKLEVE